MDHQLWSQPPTSNVRWLPHYSTLNPSCPPSRVQRTASMPVLASPPSQISQPLQQTATTPHEILDLQADIKKVLEHVVASHEEQKNMSKGVDELAIKVKVLERVLCGDVGCPRKSMDPVVVQKGGLVQRLADMDTTIDTLLGLVTCLKTDRGPPVYHDASVSACEPHPLVQNGLADLPETLPLSSTHLLRPLFPSLRCSSDSHTPINWNANPPNSRRVSLSGFPPHEPGCFFSSSLATPSPDSPHGETFGRGNDKVSSRSLASSQTELGSLNQNLLMTSPSHTSNSLSNLTKPSSAEATHTANSCIPPKFNSRKSVSTPTSKTALSHLTPTGGTTPSHCIPPAFGSVPVSSHSTHTTIINSMSPTRTPNSALSRARAASLSRTLSGVQRDTEVDVDCEGLCVDCKAERWVQQECQGQTTGSPAPQSPIKDFRGQNAEDRTGISSDVSIGELHSPPRSVEADANAEACLPMLGTVLEVESMAPHTQPDSRTSSNDASHVAATEEDMEPCYPGPIWSREVADVTRNFYGADQDESMQLDHVTDAGGSGAVRPDNWHELGREDAGEWLAEAGLQIGSEDEDLDGLLNEYVQSTDENYATAFVPNPGNPSQQTVKDQYQVCPSEYSQELLTDSEDDLQPDDVLTELCQSYSSELRFDTDHLDQYQPHAEYSREPTPADSLLQDEEAVAAVLAAVPDSPEEACTPLPTSSLQPEREEQDAACPEYVTPGRSVAVIALPYHPPSPSLSSELSSLSPLSSPPQSPPPLEKDFSDKSGRRNGMGVELRKTESLHSDEEFGTHGTFSEPSVSAVQKTTMLGSTGPRKSDASLASRGGPSAPIEEPSVLARRNPRKFNINLSDLKRKLELSGCAIEQAEKRTRFDNDAHKSMDTTSSSCANMIRDLNAEDPPRQSPSSSMSMQNVTSLRVESISMPMGAGSASASRFGTISQPATRAKMKRMAASAHELPVDSTQVPKNRVRAVSQKARESATQKGRQPRRNAGGVSSKRAPQKRKSKSKSFQDDDQMCQWPAKGDQDGSLQRQFMQCDICNLWYHFGCVGIVEGDPRLEPEAAFLCPPCCVSTAKRRSLLGRNGMCARPDCLYAHLKAQEFVIERLVGRKSVGQAGYIYLVKWEGYPITQATWTPGGNLDGAPQTFDRFLADAKAEGIDLRTKAAVLLEEARVGGWKA